MQPATSAKQFFEEVVPQQCATQHELFRASTGRVCFLIQGCGAWTVRMGSMENPVTAQPDLDAELVVGMSQASFAALMSGSVPGEEVVCMGDSKLLQRFGKLFLPPLQGSLAARLANTH